MELYKEVINKKEKSIDIIENLCYLNIGEDKVMRFKVNSEEYKVAI